MVHQVNRSWTRIFSIITITLVAVFSVAQTAHAEGIITDGKIPAGKVIDNDAIIFGEHVVVDGSVNGDLIALGTTVTINGDVNGSLITAGQDITIDGEIQGSVYSIGSTLNLGPSSKVERNVYFTGLRLVTEPGSVVGRDLVAASLRAQLAGQVGRDFKATIGLLEFIDIIREGVEEEVLPELQSTPADEPDNDETDEAKLDSKQVVFTPASKRLVSYSNHPTGEFRYEQISTGTRNFEQINTSGIQTDVVTEWALDRAGSFVTYLIVGLLVVWLLPNKLTDWSEKIRSAPLQSSGYGLLGLVIAFNGFVIATVLAAIILTIGLGLGYITLWNLAFYFWGIGYSSLVLAFSLFTLFVFYVSKVIVSYLVGLMILERIAPNAANHKIIALILGLLIYVLLIAIPYFGWAVSVIAMIFGLGAVWLVFRGERKTSSQPAVVSEE